MKKKQDLKNLTRNELIDWFENNNWQGFRAKQVFNWIYKNGSDKFEEMSNLPGDLIKRLKDRCYLSNLSLIEMQGARDGTIKYLWQLQDEETIESVYLPYLEEGRHSVCISSQVGCALGCKFCATGLNGLVRNLTPGEIIDQVLKIQADISSDEFGNPRLTNIVFMGMGEPLANLNSVLKAVDILNEEKGFNISKRKITISTAGLVPGINRLAQEDPQVGLAISLTAPNNKLRNEIMPINKKYPLDELIETVRNYINVTGRRVTFEYVLIKDINDSLDLAMQLVEILQELICHVNLIPLNSVAEVGFERPSDFVIDHFKSVLDKQGISVTIRQERGTHIEAACGQLRR